MEYNTVQCCKEPLRQLGSVQNVNMVSVSSWQVSALVQSKFWQVEFLVNSILQNPSKIALHQ